MDITEIIPFKTESEWRDLFLPNLEGVQWLIEPYGSKKHAKHFQKLLKPYQRLINNDCLPEDKDKEIIINSIVGIVVTDWRGFESGGGNYPYSDKALRDLLNEHSWLIDPIIKESRALAGELVKEQEKEKGEAQENLKK